MRYLLAHVLDGKAADYHRRLTDRLAERFGISDVNERIPPHLTLKSPFMQDDPNRIHQLLTAYTQDFSPAEFKITGFDHFHKRVLYLDIQPTAEMTDSVERLTERLAKTETITLTDQDRTVSDNLHATVARAGDDEQFAQLRSAVRNLSVDFACQYDSVSVLQQTGGGWRVIDTYAFE